MQTRFTLQMQGVSFLKKIRYNKSFYENYLTKLDDDILRFILLHEEGHIKNGSSVPYYIIAIVSILFLLLFWYPFNYGLFNSLIFILIFFPLSYRFLYISLRKEEFKADEFAAISMKNGYNIFDSTELLRNMFQKVDEITTQNNQKSPFSMLLLIFIILIGFFPDYHPAPCERIANVKKMVLVSNNTD